jgi:hypothetical protein
LRYPSAGSENPRPEFGLVKLRMLRNSKVPVSSGGPSTALAIGPGACRTTEAA